MEQNLHETTSWWKTYGKQLFSEDLEVRDVGCFVKQNFGLMHSLVNIHL
jgi:hypothetical protein